MLRRILPCAFVLAWLSVACAPGAWAWGREGHLLICALAERQLSPEAREMVETLLENGERLEGGKIPFPEACRWPDKVRHTSRQDTYEHHFLNVPDGAATVDLARDCVALSCIAVGVQRAVAYLAQAASGEREVARQAAALRYLGHYVGDLHQPLHVSNASDRGGNRITVKWLGKKTNLHAVWDYHLIETAGLKHPDSLEYLASVEPPADAGGSLLSLLDWMQESLSLARSNAYAHASGEEVRPGDSLQMDYLERNKPVVIVRLTLAAHRLARLLNRIADGDTPAGLILQPAPW